MVAAARLVFGGAVRAACARSFSTTRSAPASNIVNESTFKAHVLEKKTPVVVDFFADWCRPCHMLYPKLEKTVAGYSGKVELFKVDIDESTSLAQQYQVTSIPMVAGFIDGKEVSRFVGVRDEKGIKQFIDDLIAPGK